MKVDKIVDEDGNIINYWRIESPYTPWWMSEISELEGVKWINVGYINPLSTEYGTVRYILAASAMNYASWRN